MRTTKLWFGWVIVFLLVGGCGPSASQPLINSQDMIATIAAATVAALPTNTPYPTWTASPSPTRVRTTPTELPSNTPAPTIPILNSPTPIIILPGPGTSVSGGGLGPNFVFWTATPQPYRCSPVLVDPDDYQIFTPRYAFKARWRVWNRGSVRWKKDDVVFYFIGGDKMHNDLDRADGEFIPVTVQLNDKVLLQVAMTSPKEPGLYSTTWGLRRLKSSSPFCLIELTIRVQPKK